MSASQDSSCWGPEEPPGPVVTELQASSLLVGRLDCSWSPFQSLRALFRPSLDVFSGGRGRQVVSVVEELKARGVLSSAAKAFRGRGLGVDHPPCFLGVY